MGAMVGLVRKEAGDVARPVIAMLDTMKHRGSGVWKIAVDGLVLEPDYLRAEHPKGKVAIGSLIKHNGGSAKGFERDGRLILAYDGEIFGTKSPDRRLPLVKLLSTCSEDTMMKTVKKCIRRIDGVYALVLTDGVEILRR